jgi:hypothetical protein
VFDGRGFVLIYCLVGVLCRAFCHLCRSGQEQKQDRSKMVLESYVGVSVRAGAKKKLR